MRFIGGGFGRVLEWSGLVWVYGLGIGMDLGMGLGMGFNVVSWF